MRPRPCSSEEGLEAQKGCCQVTGQEEPRLKPASPVLTPVSHAPLHFLAGCPALHYMTLSSVQNVLLSWTSFFMCQPGVIKGGHDSACPCCSGLRLLTKLVLTCSVPTLTRGSPQRAPVLPLSILRKLQAECDAGRQHKSLPSAFRMPPSKERGPKGVKCLSLFLCHRQDSRAVGTS